MDIEKIEINQLQRYIDTGRSNLPANVKLYLDLLETTRALFQKYKSRQFIMNYLVKIRGLTRHKAGEVYTDTLNFFYLDNAVTKEAWRNIYAEKLDNAADVCWVLNDMEGYRRNLISAGEMRGLNKEDPPKVPDELFDRRAVLYQFDPEKLGIPKASRTELIELIDNLEDITDSQRKRFKADAGIIDIDFIEYAENSTD